ncbi:MAG TPA: hypothetical protein VIZ87_05585 [Terrimicrobium sp.]
MVFCTFVPPSGTVFDDPIQEGAFKADVMTRLLAFDPFMTKDLLPFGQKFLVKNRVLYKFRALIPLGIHRRVI